MLSKGSNESSSGVANYECNYLDLPFENILRDYRKRNLLEVFKNFPHKNFLEIGCGPSPMFMDFSDFDKMIVLEPGKMFFNMAIEQANANPKILIINDLIENIKDKLKQESFEFIYIGGVLHEIDNPDIVLQAVREICSHDTVIYSFVPNARSFHRLLAYEMGLTGNIYQKSEHDKLFQRHNVYDIGLFNELLTKNGFRVIESGSYFIKPFTHDQMNRMLNLGIIDKSCLDGLSKMIQFLPDLGAELWNICSIND